MTRCSQQDVIVSLYLFFLSCSLGFTDYSPEELRKEFCDAKQSNQIQPYVSVTFMLLKKKYNVLTIDLQYWRE